MRPVASAALSVFALLTMAGQPAAGASGEEQQKNAPPTAPAAQKEETQPKRVEAGFEMRWRLEFRDNADQQPADDFDTFLGQRLRVHLLFRIHPHLSAYVEGQDVWLFGAESDKVIHN